MKNDKKILIILLVVLVFATLTVFRDEIFNWLNLDFGSTSQQEELKKLETQQTLTETAQDTEKQNKESMVAYTGQDPKEVKPRPEVIKNFSQSQQSQFFNDIKKYGQDVKDTPELVSSWLQLAVLKKIIGDYIGARDIWEYVSVIKPQEEVSFKNLGDLYWHYLPDYPRSEKNFQTAIKNKPDDTSTYISLSELYRYSYKEKENLALGILNEGLKSNPGDLNLIKAIAYFYEDTGDRVKALEWWQKAQEKDPQNKSISQTIEDLRKK